MNARAEPVGIQTSSHWAVFAKQWRVIDVPLRPSEDDVAVYESVVQTWQRAHAGRGVRGLLLGVTAEIATMPWPAGASLAAVDHSLSMVANVWPKPVHGTAVCADWRAMPLPARLRDIALGDGCLTLLSVPEGRNAFAESLRSVLVEDGVLALRCFCRPEQPETPGQVFDALRAGHVRGFHGFKWRLAMALHGRPDEGVRLADVWDCWSAEVTDPDAFARQRGWPLEAVRSLEVYRDSETRYLFSTVEECRQSLAPQFTLESKYVGGYELAGALPHSRFPARMNAPLRLSPTFELLARLEESEWWDGERIERAQRKRLDSLLQHARETVPFYRDRLDVASWQALPILKRRDLQDAGMTLLSKRIPERFGRRSLFQSSGSTGEPVKVVRTQLETLYWRALTLRDHRWHSRDLGETLCVIRALPRDKEGADREVRRKGWGPASEGSGSLGDFAMIPLATDVSRQAEWLVKHDPAYLLTYPSNALALVDEFHKRGLSLPRLREVRTIGETLTAPIAERLRAAWNVPVVDLYSSEEVGLIALQCPSGSGLYHVQAESVKIEILDDAGRRCAPGETGRVVATSLHNFAMPLIRYDLGDYAEAAGACPCGRGLPTLARILGRRRNMLVLPNGERQWPLSGLYEYRDIAPIRRAQMIQLDRQRIEMRLVADRPVTADEERRLIEVIHRWVGHPFEVRFTYLDAFPQKDNGKFEDFISMVSA